MEQYLFQGFLVVLGVGGISIMFKWLLSQLSNHVDRLERQWEKYTDKLTDAMSVVHKDVNEIRKDLQEHILDEEYKRAQHTERLSGEISQVRNLIDVSRNDRY